MDLNDRAPIDRASDQGLSTNDYCAALPMVRMSSEAKGKLLLFPRTEMVMVPYEQHADGGWMCVVVLGNTTYRPEGYSLSVGAKEITTAIEIDLVQLVLEVPIHHVWRRHATGLIREMIDRALRTAEGAAVSDDGAEQTDDEIQWAMESEEKDREQRIRDAIAARPLHVYDIAGLGNNKYQHPKMGDHWYWCRYHKRPEHSGWAMDRCVRVGPFMTKREAILLSGVPEADEGPLGMEAEL